MKLYVEELGVWVLSLSSNMSQPYDNKSYISSLWISIIHNCLLKLPKYQTLS